MIIKNSQFNALGREMFKQFLNGLTLEIIAEYPNWKSKESFSQKYSHIESIAKYGQELNISESDSLSKFVNYLIRFNQDKPLYFGIVNDLKNININEETRIEKLFFRLAGDRDKLILIEI